MMQVYNDQLEVGQSHKVNADTPIKIEAAIRWIHANRQFLYVNGVMLDTYTASCMVAVMDGLNAENKAKYLTFPLPRMAAVAFRLLEKARAKVV